MKKKTLGSLIVVGLFLVASIGGIYTIGHHTIASGETKHEAVKDMSENVVVAKTVEMIQPAPEEKKFFTKDTTKESEYVWATKEDTNHEIERFIEETDMQAFDKIKVELQTSCDCKITVGNKYGVKGHFKGAYETVTMEVKDKTLILKTKRDYQKDKNRKRKQQQEKVEITVPNGTLLELVEMDVLSGCIDIYEQQMKDMNLTLVSGYLTLLDTHAANCEIDVTSGDLSMRNTTVDKIEADIVCGNLDFAKVAGKDVTICMTSGNVTIDEFSKGNLEVEDVSGNVKIKSIVNSNLKVSSTSGNVDINQMESSKAVISGCSGELNIDSFKPGEDNKLKVTGMSFETSIKCTGKEEDYSYFMSSDGEGNYLQGKKQKDEVKEKREGKATIILNTTSGTNSIEFAK